jgi:PAS domain S-box-containing protein
MKGKPRVLLLDDEPRFVESLENILNHYGYVCRKAFCGGEALQLMAEEWFDLALLDVELPDISGCEVAVRIREFSPQTTIIMLTGDRTVETAVAAMKLGAYDFLTKPLKHQHLLKTLEKGLEHARLKNALASSEEKYRLLSEAAWEGVALHENGLIIEANQPFLELFGYTESELREGLTLAQMLGDEILNQSGNGNGSTDSTARTGIGWNKRREEVPVEVRTRTMMYRNRPIQVLVVRDLTRRMKAERERLDLQKKLAEANKLNALGLMAGSVAHDLNNILTGIVSYPDMLLMKMDKSDRHYEQIRKMQAAGKRAAAVVSDLVAITRGRKQEKTLENINHLVSQYINSLEHEERRVQYPGVSIQTELNANVLNVCCSPQQIHKVLLNLVGNAMEAMVERGVIHISTANCLFRHPLHHGKEIKQGQEYVRLTVADNGPGIAEKDIDQIFNPFYSTKVMGKSGTGLGLSVVWNIVQDHDGWIEVKQNNPGAIFEIYLPASKEQACQLDESAQRVFGRGRGEKILIVDDQAEQNEILEQALTSFGYTTYSVTSGEAAINFLKSESVDLLVLDMKMGDGLSGRETFEIIAKNNPDQRAIVVSGFAESEDIKRTRELGVSIFMEKPVTLSKIKAAIEQSLSRERSFI